MREKSQVEEKQEEADSSQKDSQILRKNPMDYFQNQKVSKRFISFWHFFLLLFLSTTLYSSTLNLSISSNPSRINPILSSDSASSTISGWIFSGLFKFDKDGNIINDIASSHEFITPTHLKIKLKKNVLWHDGKKLTSNDVLYTFNTINNPKVFNAIKSSYAKVKEVKIINDYEVDIIYKEAYFKALSIWMVGLLPFHILKDEKDLMTSKFNKNPIGTGPYTLKTLKTSSDIILHANKNYYLGVPKITKIKYKFIPDPNTSYVLLNQGKLDMEGLTPLQVERQLKKDFLDKFTIYEKQSFSYTYMGFNLKREKFKDIRIRQAINLALDKKELVDILFFSHGKVCTGPFLPGSYVFNKSIKAPKTNIQKAKELLKEAGFNDENPFEFTVITNANNEIRVNATLIMQHQLQKAGIKMKIRVLEWQAFLNTVVFPKNFDALVLGWSLALIPDARSIWHSQSRKKGGFNFVSYKNDIVDKNIELAEKTVDKDKFGKLYQEIFKEISQDLPYIFLYVPNSITAVSKKIKNVSPSLIGVTHNQENWIKK